MAIWGFNKLVVTTIIALLCGEMGTYIFGWSVRKTMWLLPLNAHFVPEMVRIVRDLAWSPVMKTCFPKNTETTQPIIFATFIADFILLGAMLTGLLRKRGAGRFGFWAFLWNQVGSHVHLPV